MVGQLRQPPRAPRAIAVMTYRHEAGFLAWRPGSWCFGRGLACLYSLSSPPCFASPVFSSPCSEFVVFSLVLLGFAALGAASNAFVGEHRLYKTMARSESAEERPPIVHLL